jgi:NAD(P)-dependent dehydrogenase (short-subunit alcohol dehydrogenase family)
MVQEAGDGSRAASPTEGCKLLGQVAVVTGGGRGLGRAVACRLAAEGVNVAVAARSTDELDKTVRLIEESGGQATAFAMDVSNAEAVQQLIDAVERDAGPVDLLVNNAAVIPPLGPIWEVAPEDWWRLMEINLFGTFLCARAVLAGMTRRGRGRIVNVASGAGIESPPFLSAYVASKAAVIRLSEELAAETGRHGVAVFAIDPGWMSTAMSAYLADSPQGLRWTPSARSLFGTEVHVPPSRAADLVVTLATGQADDLSGRYLTVWDDVDDLLTRTEEIRRDDLHRVRLRR